MGKKKIIRWREGERERGRAIKRQTRKIAVRKRGRDKSKGKKRKERKLPQLSLSSPTFCSFNIFYEWALSPPKPFTNPSPTHFITSCRVACSIRSASDQSRDCSGSHSLLPPERRQERNHKIKSNQIRRYSGPKCRFGWLEAHSPGNEGMTKRWWLWWRGRGGEVAYIQSSAWPLL